MTIPVDHPQRLLLNHELHARLPESLAPPEQISHLVLSSDAEMVQQEREKLTEICIRFGHPIPTSKDNHLRIDLGPFRLQWEKHTEFTSYTFFRRGPFQEPFANTVIESIPQDWLAELPGQVLVAAHLAIYPLPEKPRNPDELAAALFEGNAVTGARIGEGAGIAYADFRLHKDGFSRFIIKDISLTPRQAGRAVQRLLEIESYLIQALRTYPLARRTMPMLGHAEQELAQITEAIASATTEEESELLDQLTKLAASTESLASSIQYRITAAQAYYELVQRRINELRELRVEGMQTFREFCERRMGPAMHTCETVLRLQENLSRRIGRASELLRTRVNISLEHQNQQVLSSMAERAKLQLHLQETVEGLSVAAITYYVVGLVGYLARAAEAAGLPINPDLTIGISIPVVALSVALSVRKIRRMVSRNHDVD
ncbi:conserved hypothetical protein [Nitrosococcus oceani ATCC 19707]|uniref:Membrane-anchored protein n=2 Tax=Nitrosococcus oceani TaxID=1229 RepID=Q3JBA2_NITOC|nr:DUF3422 domain-containing protein [Nitrosococcus oceani]ABA57894.1 conserved hypothetical protein [Nitrosococcus oceani ATCC 19707]EDZ68291.1 hypothetical protein NOC27_1618 [Nitrosococcus oceani AFC27]KFI19622.1 hypothetical protein IB75_07350 [Nitrosococcus oceani C-27]GEM19537.1 hypothetical protein NONS58_09280 [Nitrosococcus oceani]